MKQQIKEIPISNAPTPLKIKEGRVQIILEDKNGNKKVVENHNLQTDAINEFFANCGWLNSDNVDKNNIVENLLGGIVVFDDEIDEDATIIQPPANLNMVANGAVGTTNTGTPYELGSCSSIATETGWQADGSYLQTYRWDENHGNGTVASLALCAKQMGFAGFGNPSNKEKTGVRLDTIMQGNQTAFVMNWGANAGITAHVSIKNSEAYHINLTDIANGNITLEKFRMPTRKINLAGGIQSPVKLSSTTITTSDTDLVTILTAIKNHSANGGQLYNYYDAYDHFWVWNSATSSSSEWSQYIWDINVVTGTITKYTIPNTSGNTLHGIFKPVFVGMTVAFIDGYFYNAYNYNYDATKIYVCTMSNGSAGQMSVINNTNGWGSGGANYVMTRFGFSDDKIVICANDTYWQCLDLGNETLRYINVYTTNQTYPRLFATDCSLVSYTNEYTSGPNTTWSAVVLYRNINYIATIYNCETPFNKDSSTTMTIVYRLTFDENPGTNA